MSSCLSLPHLHLQRSLLQLTVPLSVLRLLSIFFLLGLLSRGDLDVLGLLCEDELDVAGVAHVGCKVNKMSV